MFLSLVLLQATITSRLQPSANCWVYSRAAAPSDDKYLRAWGQGGLAVGDTSTPDFDFSWSVVAFDVNLVEPDELKSAHLILTHIADPVWTETEANESPLEARLIEGKLDEAKWSFANWASVAPSPLPATILGKSVGTPHLGGKTFTIDIDLTEGPSKFSEALKRCREKKELLTLALTSKMEPQGGSGGRFYKVYSRFAEPALRPILELVTRSKQ